jgi:Zinc finger C-x8-C-x5-C-x3-H type (and similar)
MAAASGTDEDQPTRIGIDCGGVLLEMAKGGSSGRGEDTIFSSNFLSSPQEPGAFEAVKSMVGLVGADNVFVVSKCGDKVEQRTRQWLHHGNFFETTGFLEENLRFCKQRHEKAPICAVHDIRVFVDDRLDIIESVLAGGGVQFGVWFGARAETRQIPRPFREATDTGPHCVACQNWDDALKAITSYCTGPHRERVSVLPRKSDTPDTAKVSDRREVPVCRYWSTRGSCKYGESCRFLHNAGGSE